MNVVSFVDPKGQAAIETLMAVMLIMGVFVVISMISVQRSEINRQLGEQDQNAALCDRIAGIINKAGEVPGNLRMGVFLDRPVWVSNGNLLFGLSSGHYCFYLGRVSGDRDAVPMYLAPGYYEIRKEREVISIASASQPE